MRRGGRSMKALIGAIFVLALVSIGLFGYVLYRQYTTPSVTEMAQQCVGGSQDCIKDLVTQIDPKAQLVRSERYEGVAPGTTFEFVSPTMEDAKVPGCHGITISNFDARYQIFIGDKDYRTCMERV